MLQSGTISAADARPDLSRSRGPAPEHEMRDAAGRPIGRVPHPKGRPRVGRGAGTILLIRG